MSTNHFRTTKKYIFNCHCFNQTVITSSQGHNSLPQIPADPLQLIGISYTIRAPFTIASAEVLVILSKLMLSCQYIAIFQNCQTTRSEFALCRRRALEVSENFTRVDDVYFFSPPLLHERHHHSSEYKSTSLSVQVPTVPHVY